MSVKIIVIKDYCHDIFKIISDDSSQIFWTTNVRRLTTQGASPGLILVLALATVQRYGHGWLAQRNTTKP